MIKFPTKKRVDVYKNAVSSEQLQQDLAAAQEFIFDAWETDDLDAVLKLIRKAIKKSPLCADAYSFYSKISEESPESKVSYLNGAVCCQHRTWRRFPGIRGQFLGICRNTSLYESKSSFG